MAKKRWPSEYPEVPDESVGDADKVLVYDVSDDVLGWAYMDDVMALGEA